MILLSVWSLKELCISSMTPPLSPELIQQSLTPLAVILTSHRLSSFVEPAGHWLNLPLLWEWCERGQTAETLQASYRRRRVWRRRGWEAFGDSCTVVHKSCADLFGSIPGSTRGRHDYTLWIVVRGTCVFFSQFAAARGWIKWICRSMSSEGWEMPLPVLLGDVNSKQPQNSTPWLISMHFNCMDLNWSRWISMKHDEHQ